MSSQLNVSFEPHLAATLQPLLPILHPEIQNKLASYLADPKRETIPYELLHCISQWSRSPSGTSALRNTSPPLNPNDYSMISLLAGTTTSPERKFGAYVPPKEPEEVIKETKRERKAITTIVNGVLSVAGSGAAAWVGSERTGWKHEWRVLFTFFVAVVIAFSETVLYIIWQTRSSAPPTRKVRRRRHIASKKDDGENEVSEHVEKAHDENSDGLRLRAHTSVVDND